MSSHTDIKNIFNEAQNYMTSNNFEKALECYQKRVNIDDKTEEQWYCQLKIGDIFRTEKKWQSALDAYLKAYELRPFRAEPLYFIAKYYRENNNCNLACFFARQGMSISMPKEDKLFLQESIYKYEFLFELSIAAYYTNQKELGFEAADRLTMLLDVPKSRLSLIKSNLFYYICKLPAHQKIKVDFDRPIIESHKIERYRPMNPSVCQIENGYLMICRTINYDQVKGYYTIYDPNKTIYTRNFILQYDKGFILTQQYEVTENLERNRVGNWNIKGLEDARLFKNDNRWWFTCTTLDTNPKNCTQISLCRLSEEPKEDKWNVDLLLPLEGPNPNRNEKNWLPWVEEG